MKLQIVKKTVVNGKEAGVGFVFDSSELSNRDARILLCTGKVKKFEEAPQKIETANANPKAETANAAPKKGKRGGK